MNKSLANSRSRAHVTSLAETGELFTSDLSIDTTPGSMNDEHVIRGIITEAIRTCGKSREAIADEMSVMLGTKVTKRALDSYTSSSAEQNRWPHQYTRAFCHVTGDHRLIRCVSERAGLHVISKAEMKFMELGKQLLILENATKRIAELKSSLAEVSLG